MGILWDYGRCGFPENLKNTLKTVEILKITLKINFREDKFSRIVDFLHFARTYFLSPHENLSSRKFIHAKICPLSIHVFIL